MFGMEYVMSLVKVLFKVGYAVVAALPFKIAWNCVAPTYLVQWLPEKFLVIPYSHMIAILLVVSFVGDIIKHLTPKFVSVSQSNSNEVKEKK